MKWAICLIALLILSGCSSNQIYKYQNKYPLVVKTKIFVEFIGDVPARTTLQIINDISAAEYIYRDIDLHFHIVSIDKIEYNPYIKGEDYLDIWSKFDKEYLHVYYIFTQYWMSPFPVWSVIYGKSEFPWMYGNGFYITAYCKDYDTFAHEFGHSLGLYHVWEDNLSDTKCKEPSTTNNVMDYIFKDVSIKDIEVSPKQLDECIKHLYMFHSEWIEEKY